MFWGRHMHGKFHQTPHRPSFPSTVGGFPKDLQHFLVGYINKTEIQWMLGTMTDYTSRATSSSCRNNSWQSSFSKQPFGSTVCFILHVHRLACHDMYRVKQRLRWRAPSCICCSRPPEDVGNSAARALVLRAGERASARASSHSFDAGLDVDLIHHCHLSPMRALMCVLSLRTSLYM